LEEVSIAGSRTVEPEDPDSDMEAVAASTRGAEEAVEGRREDSMLEFRNEITAKASSVADPSVHTAISDPPNEPAIPRPGRRSIYDILDPPWKHNPQKSVLLPS
jgi:hypothetical protein